MYAQSGGDLRLSAGCMPLGGPRPSWFSCRLQANHHLLVPPAAQEVPLGGSAESPDVAIGAILPPACLVGVDHRAAPDALQYLVHRRLGLSGHLVDGPDDGADAQAQLVDGLQLPLNGAEGQPPLFPQGRDQAEHVYSQSLFPPAPPRPSPPWAPGVSHTLGKSWR